MLYIIHTTFLMFFGNKWNLWWEVIAFPQAFKTHMLATNIYFRGQPILILSQHKPYVYLDIILVPSL